MSAYARLWSFAWVAAGLTYAAWIVVLTVQPAAPRDENPLYWFAYVAGFAFALLVFAEGRVTKRFDAPAGLLRPLPREQSTRVRQLFLRSFIAIFAGILIAALFAVSPQSKAVANAVGLILVRVLALWVAVQMVAYGLYGRSVVWLIRSGRQRR